VQDEREGDGAEQIGIQKTGSSRRPLVTTATDFARRDLQLRL
jgi:hypothetical protein